jgi:hypothetical protein
MQDFDPNRDLGRDDLPLPFAEATTDGVQATFDAAGRLVRLATLRDGVVDGHEILIDPERGTGSHAQVRTVRDQGDGELRAFVLNAIDELVGSLPDGPKRCAFCLKTKRQVGAMLAGARCCICDECVRACSDVLAAD